MSRSSRKWRRRIGHVSVYRRGSRYWIYYRQGRQIRRPAGTDRDGALALAAKINLQLAEGQPTALAFRPIEIFELISEWLDHHEHTRLSSIATIRRYRAACEHLSRFISGRHGTLRADRFTSRGAEDFVRYLRSAQVSPNGHPNTAKRPLRDKGIVFILGTCRALFGFASQQRPLPAYSRNPFTGLAIERLPIDDAKLIRPLTVEQELAFFKA